MILKYLYFDSFKNSTLPNTVGLINWLPAMREKIYLTMKKTLKLKKLVLFSVWILFSYLSYSQENFLPGFVINNSGDTLKGFIDYRNWAINPKVVDFKSPATSHPTTFIPPDIKEFSVKDEIYVSGIVEVENTSIEENRLQYDSKLKITVDTIFLQTLLRRKKGLYYYMNNNGRVNFMINVSSINAWTTRYYILIGYRFK